MKLLSADSFDRARTFVMEQGREMDRRLLSFHFDDGPRAAVLEELANYQNEDGGFGRGLEPDVQMPGLIRHDHDDGAAHSQRGQGNE